MQDKLKMANKNLVVRRVNDFNRDFNASRLITDEILGMSGPSLAFENEICIALFGKDNYVGCSPKERKLLHKAYYFVLGREMKIIDLTFKYLKDIKARK